MERQQRRRTATVTAGTTSYSVSGSSYGDYSNTGTNGTSTLWVLEGVQFPSNGICASLPGGIQACNTTTITASSDTSVELDAPITHTFSGVLTDSNGNPLPNVGVELSNSTASANASTNPTTGQFSTTVSAGLYNLGLSFLMNGQVVDGLPLGSFLIDTNGANGISEDLSAGDVSQNLALSLVKLSVTVKDSSGNPIAGVRWNANSGGGTATVTAGTTSYSVSGSSYGDYSNTGTNGTSTLWVLEGVQFPSNGICASLPGGIQACNTTTITASSDTSVVFQPAPPVPMLGMPAWTNNPMTTTQSTTVTVPVSDALSGVAGGEYYLGTTDPGQGNGTAMTLSGGNLTASFANMAAGIYTINFRAKDTAGDWSSVTTDYLVVYSVTQTSADGHSNKVMPVYGSDVLPWLTQAGQTDTASFAFTVKYKNGSLDTSSKVHFDYNTGSNCKNSNKATNCHSTSLDSTSIAWMVVSGTNNSQATIQGTATLTIDGTTTTNPFRIIATDGARLNPATADQFELEIYAPGANPNTASPIYILNDPLTNGNVIVKG